MQLLKIRISVCLFFFILCHIQIHVNMSNMNYLCEIYVKPISGVVIRPRWAWVHPPDTQTHPIRKHQKVFIVAVAVTEYCFSNLTENNDKKNKMIFVSIFWFITWQGWWFHEWQCSAHGARNPSLTESTACAVRRRGEACLEKCAVKVKTRNHVETKQFGQVWHETMPLSLATAQTNNIWSGVLEMFMIMPLSTCLESDCIGVKHLQWPGITTACQHTLLCHCGRYSTCVCPSAGEKNQSRLLSHWWHVALNEWLPAPCP